MISLARTRGEVSFTLFSSLGELIQEYAKFWTWLPLGLTVLLVMDPASWRGVWVGEDGIGEDFPWGRGFVFVWDRVYYMEGLGLLSEEFVLGYTLFWPILPP